MNIVATLQAIRLDMGTAPSTADLLHHAAIRAASDTDRAEIHAAILYGTDLHSDCPPADPPRAILDLAANPLDLVDRAIADCIRFGLDREIEYPGG